MATDTIKSGFVLTGAVPRGEGEDDRVTFDERQQARVDQIVREAQGRAAKELRDQLAQTNTQLQTLQSELNEAKEALKKAKTPGDKSAAQDDIDALRSQIAEMKQTHQNVVGELERHRKLLSDKDVEVQKAKNEAQEVRKRQAISAAAQKANFIDLDDICQLTGNSVKWDESRGRWVVIGENGSEKLNSSYEPMSLEEFYNDMAGKKPWLVRGDVRGGIGSKEADRVGMKQSQYTIDQIFGPKSDSRLANKLGIEDPKLYQQLRKKAVEAGLIA